jgi:hypothetical protein
VNWFSNKVRWSSGYYNGDAKYVIHRNWIKRNGYLQKYNFITNDKSAPVGILPGTWMSGGPNEFVSISNAFNGKICEGEKGMYTITHSSNELSIRHS